VKEEERRESLVKKIQTARKYIFRELKNALLQAFKFYFLPN
jgi:hypothetical protein